ncbi:MAG TPA: reactive intermediate/imine deaminase [Aquifex aeolicus]|uniref:Reactive intermediate/imine deaminase n=1 Tax=Aquifex aeolicus TaxID=63363 RepID=A0A9D0YPX9_AQUAO|nr:reactive intermediate/imine deaminase [Aquificales bacterium]HIP98474.1 reactive intermediate/imine deaminase [Aquifex aeolicus]HIQ25839.1 reactive intermediate/imine deaminase [Aquifex aeolicus]
MHFVQTDKAPKPVGAYSQAVVVGNLVFISGQIAINPQTGKLEGKTAKEQTQRVLNNIKAILSEIGLTEKNIVKTAVYLTDLSNFKEVNEVYGDFFKGLKPARETVEVSNLPLGALVEISAIAVIEDV